MSSILSTIFAWIVAGLNALLAPARTQQATTAVDPLAALVAAQNYAFGPMPVTGGVIHKITQQVAAQVAADIRAASAKYAITVVRIAAWIRQESDFDPQAIDPNNQDAAAGETPAQALQHADLGIGQFDMKTLEGMPQFAGWTPVTIKAKAEDADWGVDAFGAFIAELRKATNAAIAADATLLAKLPNANADYLWIQFYNQGPTGTLLAIASGTISWKYAQSVLDREQSFRPVIGAA